MLAIYEDGPEASAAPDVLLIHGGAEDAGMLAPQGGPSGMAPHSSRHLVSATSAREPNRLREP